MPGDAGCVVLVTTRYRLDGLVALHGARQLPLDVLSKEDAEGLLRLLLGENRSLTGAAASVADLARRCARLPLALRLAAATLVRQPHRPIENLVTELGAGNPLGALELADDPHASVRAAFAVSYHAVSPDARRLFRRLGLLPGADFTPESAATLVAEPAEKAAGLLDTLADAHLVEQHGLDRYRLHDLLRHYAAERAQAEDTARERAAAAVRLSRWYLRRTDAAIDILHPNLVRLPRPRERAAAFPDAEHALAWLEAERQNVVAAAYSAGRAGPSAMAWELADAIRGFLMSGIHRTDWLGTLTAGLAAARSAGDLRAQAAMCIGLGFAFSTSGDYCDAIEYGNLARTYSEKTGWDEGVSGSVALLGVANAEKGNMRAAAEYFADAVRTAQRKGNHARSAVHLANLGGALRALGEPRAALVHQQRAVELHRAHGSSWGEVLALSTLSGTCHDLGRLGEAVEHLNRALALGRRYEFRFAEADVLTQLAAVHCDAGRYQEAVSLALRAAATARRTGNPGERAASHSTLAAVLCRLGSDPEAVQRARSAVDIARAAGLAYHEAVALVELAGTRCIAPDEALRHAGDAHRLAEQGGFRMVAGRALTRQAELHLKHGATATAAAKAAAAATLHRGCGHLLAEARALHVQGRAEPDPQLLVRALEIFETVGVPEAAEVRALLAIRVQ